MHAPGEVCRAIRSSPGSGGGVGWGPYTYPSCCARNRQIHMTLSQPCNPNFHTCFHDALTRVIKSHLEAERYEFVHKILPDFWALRPYLELVDQPPKMREDGLTLVAKACSKNGNDLNLMSELEKNCCKQRGRFQGRDLIELQDSCLCANKIDRHSVLVYIAGRPTPSNGIPVQHAFDLAVKFTLSVLSMPLGEKLQAFDSCRLGRGFARTF